MVTYCVKVFYIRETTESYCYHFGVGLGVGVTLKVHVKVFFLISFRISTTTSQNNLILEI